MEVGDIWVFTSHFITHKCHLHVFRVIFRLKTALKRLLESFFGVIGLVVLCTYIPKVDYFDAQIRKTLLYK